MFEPTLTVRDVRAAPSVDVAFPALPAGAASITVRASFAGGSYEVREAIDASVAGAFSILDREPPIDVPVEYRAETFNAAGASLGFTDAAQTLVDSPAWEDGLARFCVHNPFNPDGAVWVAPAESMGSATSPTVFDSIRPQGSRLALAGVGRRQGVTDLPFEVITMTFDEGERFDSLFGTAETERLPVLCVRVPAALRRLRLPARWFAGVQALPRTVFANVDAIVWRLVVDEVAAPLPALGVPTLTRADFDAYYGSRSAMDADNATRFDLDRRYDLAGSAG